MYDDGNIECKKLTIKETLFTQIDCNNKTPEQINLELQDAFKDKDVPDKIVLIRFKGKLKLGRSTDIDLKSIIHSLYEKGAYFVMKNTSAITSSDFEDVKKDFNPDLLEEEVIKEHLGQTKVEGLDLAKEKELISSLITTLSKEKQEGETNQTYEDRLMKDIDLSD